MLKLTLQYISICAPLIPLLIFIFRRSHFVLSKWLLFYLLISLVNDVLLMMIAKGRLVFDSYYLIHGFMMAEFILLSFYFQGQKIFPLRQRCLIPAITGLGLAAYWYIVYCTAFAALNGGGCALFSLIIISYAIFGFEKLTRKAVPVFLEQTALFWTTSGFLLFFSACFFLYLLWQHIPKSGLANSLWFIVHDGFNIIKCIFIAVSFTRKTDQ
ncbi:MAG: hypothetical protein WC716_15150 [Chitinophagaceae bacterium]|jgi:hypothetical protein